ncbi:MULTISPECIES: ABC transporter ATP-binding protein [unclassified Dietzia]|uniref:ABC transporter ATP-binding protein n=1 Tax=unclassified Dietzia TaxID=2617939 RepID=UPI000D208D89|nr:MULTISPECIES: ABC transporter ATP-binding protein [unclassified Dietzia]AVZ39217.1 ABC transporter ATP-binding protein [Dietzia sp. JS16-p6b]MBB1024461.1 ABC transporter ATP-binding protein [Dietzia sp. DQ12-76]MBB1026358.1 ABC transporter ATP-binding protein [Dietzia sp. DQ11-38-2]QGW24444.1 ABC transporter-related protein [Dietzia sp. DQ12-45-1b]
MTTTTRTGDASAPGLRLNGVELTFRDGDQTLYALDGVDVEVARGEVLAVVGPSGAGKSSLLAVAGGLLSPTSGTVEVGGRDITGLGRRDLTRFRRDHVGFVFQSGNLVPALTARDQLRLVRTLGGDRSRRRDPDHLLEAVGLTHRARRRPATMSGGERQRVGIARALMSSPDLLLVDEPTAALDRRTSHDVVRLLAEETHQNGVATVLVTHDHEILEHCDRVLEMVDGRLHAHV